MLKELIKGGSSRLAILLLSMIMLIGTMALPPARVQAVAITPYFGEVALFPYGAAPDGWAACDGALMVISKNTVLYSLLGNAYGGDGKSSFGLPDLRGKEPMNGLGYYIAVSGIYPPRDGDADRAGRMTGEVILFAGHFAIGGSAKADGSSLSASGSPELYRLLGTEHGGSNGGFNLPSYASPLAGDDRYDGLMSYQIVVNGASSASRSALDYVGEIVLSSQSKEVPGGWLPADGRQLPVSNYQLLDNALNGLFGRDSMSFRIPDVRNKLPMQSYVSTTGVLPQLPKKANPDYYETIMDTPLVVVAPGVLSNDEGRNLSALPVKQPLKGTVILNSNGSLQYFPAGGFIGTDSFVYQINGTSEEATVTIKVLSPDVRPVVSGVTDQGIYSSGVTISFTGGTATLNGGIFATGGFVNWEASYVLIVTSPHGTYTETISFRIDKTPPIVSGVVNGGNYNKPVTITFNEGMATLNGKPFASGTTVRDEGQYRLVVVDAAGLETARSFSIHMPKTVSFDSSGGSAVPAQAVEHGDAAAKPADPSRSGYAFGGWYSDAGLTAAYDFAAPVVAAVELHAKWTKLAYAVSFDSDGGSAVPAQAVEHGDAAAKPADPLRSGYAFGGWYSDAGLTAAYDFTAPVVAAVQLHAKWTKLTYAVSFDSSGGSAVPAQTVEHGDAAAKPADPVRSGYAFGGWYSDAGLTATYDFAAPVVAAVELHAKWTKLTYAVSFDSDGGSAVPAQTVEHGDAAAKPADPVRSGYAFGGWYSDAGLTAAYDFAAPVVAAVQLHAKWTKLTYAVSFDSSGGSAVPAQTVEHGEAAAKPADPVRSGYAFGGWYSDAGLTAAYDFAAPVVAAVQLHAKWTKVEVTPTPTPTATPTATPTPTPEPSQPTWTPSPSLAPSPPSVIDLNGIAVKAVIQTTVTSEGRSLTNYVLDGDSLYNALAQLNLPMAALHVDAKTDEAEVEFPAYSLQRLPSSVMEISFGDGSYRIPAALIGSAAPQAGISVRLGALGADGQEKLSQALAKQGLTQEPGDKAYAFTFRINGQEITDFNGVYTERTLVTPAGSDKELFAVYVGDDGRAYFVPASFSQRDGQRQATIRSPHNSVYTLVSSSRTFSDLSGHWAEQGIGKLGRLGIVTGDGNDHFNPSRSITRAEFAALLVRSLGLLEKQEALPFLDVPSEAWYSGAVGAAYKAGLVNGVRADSFDPSALVTREQMAVMLVKAMEFAGYDRQADADVLGAYSDNGSISAWARDGLAAATSAGLLSGVGSGQLAPKASADRAQSAVMLLRMLELLQFIER